jgi:hypothetical protein
MVSTCVWAVYPTNKGGSITYKVKEGCCGHSDSMLVDLIVFPAFGVALKRTKVERGIFQQERSEGGSWTIGILQPFPIFAVEVSYQRFDQALL